MLGVTEHRLDRLLSLAVQLFARVTCEHAPHERVPAAGPARSFSLAFAASLAGSAPGPVLGDDVVDVLLVPILGVGDDDRRLVGDADLPSSSIAVSSIGRSCDQSVGLVVISAASTICCSLTTACAL